MDSLYFNLQEGYFNFEEFVLISEALGLDSEERSIRRENAANGDRRLFYEVLGLLLPQNVPPNSFIARLQHEDSLTTPSLSK